LIDSIEENFRQHAGFKFLKKLKRATHKKIVVQPFPRVSCEMVLNPNWLLNQLYESPIDAYRFISKIKDDFLKSYCEDVGVRCLPYPDCQFVHGLFTPSDFMRVNDGVHSKSNYGNLVLCQILDEISK
jgi:hypothetical protein